MIRMLFFTYCCQFICTVEYIQIQMHKNTFRKELQSIEGEIDDQMERIDELLKLLANKQQNNKPDLSKLSKQTQPSWNGSGEFLESHQQLNETCEETDYHNTGTSMFYNFQQLRGSSIQEILLDDYKHYDSTYVQQIILLQPKSLSISTKGNWVTNYLDESDTQVMFDHDGEMIFLKSIENGCFNCQTRSEIQQNIEFTIESERIYKMQNLRVSFPYHMHGYQLKMNVSHQKIIYQLSLQQKSRILIQSPNQQLEIIRFLLLKEEEDENYEIVWGVYSQQAICQSLTLEAGTYILLPLPGADVCNIYVKDRNVIQIKRQTQHPFKSFNLLKKSFEECRQSLGLKRAISLISDEQGIKKEFGRSCYMNYGIILEHYENIYENEAKFIDEGESKEDIKLLFQEIYTPSQVCNRLSPGQKIVKFHIITKIPANLFIPKKRVLMGNRFMENLTIHSIFK